jgi:methionyl-tRNA formyltransferase
MEAGLDTGPMLLREAVPITATTTTPELHDALAALGARLILRALAENPPPVPQPEAGASHAPKLTRDDAKLDWALDAATLDRRVRALNPWPGTTATLDGAMLKVLAATPEPGSGPPGTLLDDRLLVACGAGALRLLRVQAPGRAALDAAAFLRGHPVPAGARLG